MMRARWMAPSAALALAVSAGRADQIPCLTDATAGGPVTNVTVRYWAGRMARAADTIAAEASRLDSAEKLAAWQRRVREEFRSALGGMPERTPLNPRTVRSIDRDGYRVEIVVFESRPSHHVTASLFLPDAARFPPPHPGILVPCGHSREPRRAPRNYSRACAMAALNGMAALIYDPIDQGERVQVLDAAGRPVEWGVQGHNRLGALAILVGWNTASFRVWDGVRALDYLAGRPEVDAGKLGCMGVSGGGTMTSLLMSFDDRIGAAAPSCYISSLARVYEAIGPQDAEQNIFGQMRFGLEHAGYLLLRAPVPVLVCARTEDFFPIDGTRASVDQARAVLARMGWADRIGLTVDEGKHDWSEAHLRASVRWMRRWLRGEDALDVPPEDETGPPAEETTAVEGGQVMRLPGERSVYDFVREEAARLARERGSPAGERLRGAVRARAGIRPLAQIPAPRVVESDEPAAGVADGLRRQVLVREDGLPLPAVSLEPAAPTGAPVLLVDGRGKSAAIDRARALAAQGRRVLAVDLRGFGELRGRRAFYGSSHYDEADAIHAYVFGGSLVGERAEDLLVCARWWAQRCGATAVDLEAAGWAVTPALHAAVAEPRLFGEVQTAERPSSWSEAIAAGARHSFADVIHGVLRDYDLADLDAAIRARPAAGDGGREP